MIDTTIHAKDFYVGNYDDCGELNYNPSKPCIKSILWDNLDWIENLYNRDMLLYKCVKQCNISNHTIHLRDIKINEHKGTNALKFL